MLVNKPSGKTKRDLLKGSGKTKLPTPTKPVVKPRTGKPIAVNKKRAR